MSLRRHVAIVLSLMVVAGAGAGYQAAAADERPGSTLRLVCPLH
jgi:hypothetical protein